VNLWVFIVSPRIKASEDKIIIFNPFKTFEIEKESCELIETKWGLAVATADKPIYPWVALQPAPKRQSRFFRYKQPASQNVNEQFGLTEGHRVLGLKKPTYSMTNEPVYSQKLNVLNLVLELGCLLCFFIGLLVF
jgi:hypothetical protein